MRRRPGAAKELPISVRISAHDWFEGGITPDDAVEIERSFKAAGTDLTAVSPIPIRSIAKGKRCCFAMNDVQKADFRRDWRRAVKAPSAIHSSSSKSECSLKS